MTARLNKKYFLILGLYHGIIWVNNHIHHLTNWDNRKTIYLPHSEFWYLQYVLIARVYLPHYCYNFFLLLLVVAERIYAEFLTVIFLLKLFFEEFSLFVSFSCDNTGFENTFILLTALNRKIAVVITAVIWAFLLLFSGIWVYGKVS